MNISQTWLSEIFFVKTSTCNVFFSNRVIIVRKAWQYVGVVLYLFSFQDIYPMDYDKILN